MEAFHPATPVDAPRARISFLAPAMRRTRLASLAALDVSPRPGRTLQWAVAAGLIALIALATPAVRAAAQAAPPPAPDDAARWYRGNTHTHTTNSDGNMPPDHVVRWYRDNGYAFVVITDHETVTDVAPLAAEFAAPGRFLVMAGQEITQRIADPAHPDRRRQAHVNVIGLTTAIPPFGERGIASGMSIAETYDRHIRAAKAVGAVAQVNHPNFRWSVVPDDMSALPDSTLFEVWNGHPLINNLGGMDAEGRATLSTEALWDTLLTRGRLLFGVASDDSHAFRPADFQSRDATRPGLAWVMVRADTLTPGAIMAALGRGDFYSTTGITLAAYRSDAAGIALRMAPPSGPGDDRRYRTRFIGHGGRVLADVWGTEARYAFRGDEGYVRASVTDSNGGRLWTQPVRVERR